MFTRAHRRSLLLWLALLGVLFAALAPALSHAVARAAPSVLQVEVCSMGGMQTMLVELPGADDGVTPGAADLSQHCAWCLTCAPAVLPPPVAGFVLPVAVPGTAYPPPYYLAPRPSFAWRAAQPRAPPAAPASAPA